VARKRNLRPLILASGSPRRRHLMKAAGYRFRIVVSHAKESVPRGMGPRALVKSLALKKAIAVARRHPDAVVIGADTTVYINGHVVNKPRDQAHAVRMLKELSGAWQKVYTGVVVVTAGGKLRKAAVAVSRVKMRHLTEKDIRRASRKHLDKAGGYAVQESKDPFVEKIVGDYDNVVGLPMRVLNRLLGAFSENRR
jgi:septum formation protein